MFRRWREKIERALEAREAARPLTRDEYDDLLHSMREEIIDLKARIPKLEKQVARLDGQARETVRRAERAHAAAREARASGQSEESERAMKLVQRVLQQAEDLRRQSIEAHADLSEMKADALEKLTKLKEAQRNRGVMIARSRRAGTARQLADAMQGPESGLKRFERAEEEMAGAEDLAAATQEVEEALGGPLAAETEYELRQLESGDEMDDMERRLAELRKEIETEDGGGSDR